jgi:hypothetical protein
VSTPAPQTVVVSSVFGELYSTDAGATWGQSIGGGTSQSVRYLGVNGDGGKKFGVTGTYGSAQGTHVTAACIVFSCLVYAVVRVRMAIIPVLWLCDLVLPPTAGAAISVDGGVTFKT